MKVITILKRRNFHFVAYIIIVLCVPIITTIKKINAIIHILGFNLFNISNRDFKISIKKFKSITPNIHSTMAMM